jgi:hypothetical protein
MEHLSLRHTSLLLIHWTLASMFIPFLSSDFREYFLPVSSASQLLTGRPIGGLARDCCITPTQTHSLR